MIGLRYRVASTLPPLLGFAFWGFVLRFVAMDNDPKKLNVFKVIVLPVIFATVLALVIRFVMPEIGWFPAVSAWIGTVLFMSIWGSFYN